MLRCAVEKHAAGHNCDHYGHIVHNRGAVFTSVHFRSKALTPELPEEEYTSMTTGSLCSIGSSWQQ